MLVAGPNLTIDRTASLDELRPGAVLRFSRVVVTPGGKGLNVARAARCLGVDASLVGFVPGETGRAGAGMIAREGISLQAVPCGGELRSTAIVMERDGRTTVFNEPGPEVGPADWEAYEAAIADLLPSHGVLVCSGSVPPGSPDDAYGRLARLATRAGRPCVVDAGGVTLARAVEAGPDVVCPNLVEAEEVVGGAPGGGSPVGRAAGSGSSGGGSPVVRAAGSGSPGAGSPGGGSPTGGAPTEGVAGGDAGFVRSRAEAAAAALVRCGARAAVVTADAAGAAFATAGGERAWLPAPRIADVRNPVGAGDVFACGLAAAIERGEPLLDAVRHGIAAAAASVECSTAGELDPARAVELLAAVAPAR